MRLHLLARSRFNAAQSECISKILLFLNKKISNLLCPYNKFLLIALSPTSTLDFICDIVIMLRVDHKMIVSSSGLYFATHEELLMYGFVLTETIAC